MTRSEVWEQVERFLNRVLDQKGLPPVSVVGSTSLLNGSLGIDSLDLAVILTELERTTGKDPFRDGFRGFETVEELVQLYAD